ncbi:hypothetical protein K6119_07120 [Paracrocinitomix mangrovi]|nr:hypothetical protein [Paracrocinitomix mangrovi]UKN03283.1 hypothetical protein K6119_07120 [Paracrocinitomix mangrovi]
MELTTATSSMDWKSIDPLAGGKLLNNMKLEYVKKSVYNNDWDFSTIL